VDRPFADLTYKSNKLYLQDGSKTRQLCFTACNVGSRLLIWSLPNFKFGTNQRYFTFIIVP